jgi:hypothetical protein
MCDANSRSSKGFRTKPKGSVTLARSMVERSEEAEFLRQVLRDDGFVFNDQNRGVRHEVLPLVPYALAVQT